VKTTFSVTYLTTHPRHGRIFVTFDSESIVIGDKSDKTTGVKMPNFTILHAAQLTQHLIRVDLITLPVRLRTATNLPPGGKKIEAENTVALVTLQKKKRISSALGRPGALRPQALSLKIAPHLLLRVSTQLEQAEHVGSESDCHHFPIASLQPVPTTSTGHHPNLPLSTRPSDSESLAYCRPHLNRDI
jgi:hypothetical protein